jgi:hypothetical protein
MEMGRSDLAGALPEDELEALRAERASYLDQFDTLDDEITDALY